MYPAFTFGLPIITAFRVLPPSWTCIVHVVQPFVWPGVSRAVSFAPPELDRVAVVQDAIDVRAGPAGSRALLRGNVGAP